MVVADEGATESPARCCLHHIAAFLGDTDVVSQFHILAAVGVAGNDIRHKGVPFGSGADKIGIFLCASARKRTRCYERHYFLITARIEVGASCYVLCTFIYELFAVGKINNGQSDTTFGIYEIVGMGPANRQRSTQIIVVINTYAFGSMCSGFSCHLTAIDNYFAASAITAGANARSITITCGFDYTAVDDDASCAGT